MNEIIRNMLSRRTIRKYRPEQIKEKELSQILQAGLYAPNAGGRQSALFVVCQNHEVNQTLGRLNRDAFKGRTSTENAYVSKDQPSIADAPSLINGFYDAPTVITLFAPQNSLYAVHDCCVAAENMMLAAHSLGIGSCMVARAEASFAGDYGQAILKVWGIDAQLEPRIHVLLGYPEQGQATAKPRKKNRVIRV